jgi:DNA-binding response OmpR family regulator
MSIDELRSLGSRCGQFELLLFVYPASPEMTGQESPETQVRKVMGDGIPVLLAFENRASAPLVEVKDVNIGVATGPFTFSRFYVLLHDFAVRHRIRIDPAPPEWGSCRFHTRTHSVSIGSAEVRLTPGEFDLAIELFFSMDRVVPIQRLDFIVAAHGSPAEETSLQARVAGLRNALGSDLSREWQIESVAGVGYRLRAPAISFPENHTSSGGRSGLGTQ